MSFAAFESAIVSPDLLQVARHWRAACGARRMPAWRDIRPAAIVAQLPIIWSYKFDAASDAFTGRLAGDKITAIFGHSFRGAAMKDLFPAQEYQRAFTRHKRVVAEPAFFHGTGLVFAHLGRHGVGERIILPLAEDGEHGDGIVGATKYNMATGEPSADLARGGEREEWFPLSL
jgi:hypothetical protein